MVSMQQMKQRAAIRRTTKRAVAVLAVAVSTMAAAGSVSAAPTPRPVKPSAAAEAGADRYKDGFFETYRGHHIMGWGHNELACAYIDGKPLVLYPAGRGMYTSALQAYQPESGLRAITKASVRMLGELDITAATELPAHCPQFQAG